MEEMKHKKPDRRIAKTKRAICNAFTELMSKEEMKKITMKEIADLADVNRKTVYNYYGSINDILDEIENNVVKSFDAVLSDIDFSCNYKNLYRVFESLTELFKSDLVFYTKLNQMSTNVSLMLKLINYLKRRLRETFISNDVLKDPSKTDLVVTYIVAGMMAAYRYWFNEGQNIPLDVFTKDVSNVVIDGFKSFVK